MVDQRSWYDTGWGAAQRESEKAAQRRADSQNRTLQQWFWMLVSDKEHDNSKTVIFIDDFSWKRSDGMDVVPVCVNFHYLVLDGEWKDTIHEPCVRHPAQPPSTCILCAAGYKTRFAGLFSVLDITPFYSQKVGAKIVRPKVLTYPAGHEALLILRDRNSRLTNLKGWKFSIARHDKKSPREGSDFVHEERIDDVVKYLKDKGIYPEPQYPLDLAPYNYTADAAYDFYRKLITPRSREELQRLLASHICTDGTVYKAKAVKIEATNEEQVDYS